jgi:hypothetical protein
VTARPDRDPDRRPPPPAGGYLPALPWAGTCTRCGCLVADDPDALAAHERHHAALRTLWERGNGDG